MVLIIGILAAVGLPQYQRAVEKTRSAEAFTHLRALAIASEIYALAKLKYYIYRGYNKKCFCVAMTDAAQWICQVLSGQSLGYPGVNGYVYFPLDK